MAGTTSVSYSRTKLPLPAAAVPKSHMFVSLALDVLVNVPFCVMTLPPAGQLTYPVL